MKQYIYVIAWVDFKSDPTTLIFRSALCLASNDQEAYALGQNWATDTGILPLQSMGNDYVVAVTP